MAVLIATAFLGVTLQARIGATDDTNKDSYLKALADHIVVYPGSPTGWGQESAVPVDFGLAKYPSNGAFQLDIDKVSRLNRLNANALSYVELLNAVKLNNMSLGISVSQVMDLEIGQSGTHAVDGLTYADLSIATSINTKPVSAQLNCYVIANGYFYNASAAVPSSGSYTLTVHIPTDAIDGSYVVAFARSTFDERITSYAVYSIASGKQEIQPSSNGLLLSPQNYRLSFTQAPDVNVQNIYALTYNYNSNEVAFEGSSCAIPRLVIVALLCW
jgi:hypothetical protein